MRRASGLTYWQRRRRRNERDAFSHSLQCDDYFSIADPAPGGVAHHNCRCWCHSALALQVAPEVGFDLSVPEEYATSADAPFINAAPAPPPPSMYDPPPSVVDDLEWLELDQDPVLPEVEFKDRSRNELLSGRCDTCGDLLKNCECVT